MPRSMSRLIHSERRNTIARQARLRIKRRREPVRSASAAAAKALVSSALSKMVALSRSSAARVWLACISPIRVTTPSPVSPAMRRAETDRPLA